MREVVRRPATSAADCLREMVIVMLRWTHHHASHQPRIHELVEMIASERRDLVRQRDMRLEALLAEVLSRGNDSGEFAVDDVIRTAATVHSALRMFEVPIFMGFHDLATFETMAAHVVDLLLEGLQRR